jgi:integrase
MEVEELRGFLTVDHWLSRLADSTAEVQGNLFKHFINWMAENGGRFKDYTPDELIEYQRNCDNGSRYDILDMAQRYVSNKPGTYNTKNSRYNNIRSFFLHNRAELPADPSYNIKPDRRPIQGKLEIEHIRDAILSCNAKYQAVFTCMFQAALDQEMFKFWNLHGLANLKAQLRELEGTPEDKQVIKIDLPGRKGQKNIKGYYTFITRDAIEFLKNWLKIRADEGYGPDDPIFVSQFGTPLSKQSLRHYWIDHLKKLGIVDPVEKRKRRHKTGKGLHEMRDVWRSLWSKSPASHTVGEFLMGHTIDPLEYDKSYRDTEFYKKEYLKAAPYLNIFSRGEPYGLVKQDRMEELEAEIERLKEREKLMQTDKLTSQEIIDQLFQKYEKLSKKVEEMEKENKNTT